LSSITSILSFPTAIVLDLLALVGCALLILRFGRPSHSHPAIIYLFFHIYTFSTRLLAIALGAGTLFSDVGGYLPVSYQEILRAVVLADLVLIVMTVAWIKAAKDNTQRSKEDRLRHWTPQPDLSLTNVWLIVGIVLPIGIASLFFTSQLPGLGESSLDLGEWENSSWIPVTQSWAGLALLALIYWHGLQWRWLVPMLVYLLIIALQGYHRFRLVIPVILMIQIYLDRRQLKWPPVRIFTILFMLFLIFYPLKIIGVMVQRNASLSEIADVSSPIITDALVGQAEDQKFLDEFAAALTLIDEDGRLQYGRPYIALLTLPIPRQWWPDKPGLADGMRDLSRPWRPMGEIGAIMTFIGESYSNFGYLGIIIVPYMLAYLLARLYFRAYRSSYYSVVRFAYLLIACNLIQVFRDGLLSIVIFTLVNMMPLTLIILLHYIFPVRKRRLAYANR
jgi:hypothetical protein